MQNVKNEKPICYMSHKLSKTQCKWSTIEKEAYAIYYSLCKLDYYLHGARFVIKACHKPLKYLLESPMQNKKIQLWALSMAGYNCTKEYIEGTENTCPDLLSCKPDGGHTEAKPFEVDINDNTFEVGVINSNDIDPKQFASYEVAGNPEKEAPTLDLTDIVNSASGLQIRVCN